MTPPAGGSAAGSDGVLPDTGAPGSWLLALAGVLLAAGAGLLARRLLPRRPAEG